MDMVIQGGLLRPSEDAGTHCTRLEASSLLSGYYVIMVITFQLNFQMAINIFKSAVNGKN